MFKKINRKKLRKLEMIFFISGLTILSGLLISKLFFVSKTTPTYIVFLIIGWMLSILWVIATVELNRRRKKS